MLTVLPDLYMIWKIQRQMVADIFALYGRTAELTRTHMLYCLFRHAASQVLRDVAVRAGQRLVLEQLSTRRVAGRDGEPSASRCRSASPARPRRAGYRSPAPPRSGYAYWDTLQVAKTARKLLGVGAIRASSG